MKRSEIPFFYSTWIEYSNFDPADRFRISAIGLGRDSLEESYQELECHLMRLSHLGYEIVSYRLAKHCANCSGSGHVVSGKRVRRTKKCPHCKGEPELEIITQWEHWRTSRNMQHICHHPRLQADNGNGFECPDCKFSHNHMRKVTGKNGTYTLDEALFDHWSIDCGYVEDYMREAE